MTRRWRELGSLVFLSIWKERIRCASFRIGCRSYRLIRALLTITITFTSPPLTLTTIIIPFLTIPHPLTPTIPTITPLTLILIPLPPILLFIIPPPLAGSDPQWPLLRRVPLQDKCSNRQ